jgi:hypothetical protein
MSIDFTAVAERARILDKARAALKTEFFGIDSCIDSIIDSIKTWYLMPELISRPLIVGLFGLTGTGKTALVRSLVRHLSFTSRFIEMQMDGFSEGGERDEKSISAILQGSSIPEGEQGIILLDEFQRFRTIDSMGQDIKVERYADVWMLLSDGYFPANYAALERLEHNMVYWDYWDDEREAEKSAAEARASVAPVVAETEKPVERPPEPKYKRKYLTRVTDANTLKEVMRLNLPVREIMTWSSDKTRAMLREAIDKKDIPPLNYSKTLVFVSGNLDSAFSMSREVEDCDTDADIYHDYTKKIHSGHIKEALAQRFKPEQIARLGNNYVIYPSLSRSAYMSLIRRSCHEYTDRATEVYGVRFDIDESVYSEIYDNAVYPAQGTRPVFTSIHKLFGSPLSDAIFWARSLGTNVVKVTLNIPDSSLIFSHDGHECHVKIDLEIRARRAAHSDDFNALVAVHEAGHAIVYADLFKMPPVEIAISVASFKGGYNRFKTEHLSKEELTSRIAVGMAGIVAEELIFGQELRSTGCASDIFKSTELAASYVRRYGMDGFLSHLSAEVPGQITNNTDVLSANPVIEQLIKDQKARAQTVLVANRDLLIDLSRHLLKVKKMTASDFGTFAAGRIVDLKPLSDKDVNGDYAARLEKA